MVCYRTKKKIIISRKKKILEWKMKIKWSFISYIIFFELNVLSKKIWNRFWSYFYCSRFKWNYNESQKPQKIRWFNIHIHTQQKKIKMIRLRLNLKFKVLYKHLRDEILCTKKFYQLNSSSLCLCIMIYIIVKTSFLLFNTWWYPFHPLCFLLISSKILFQLFHIIFTTIFQNNKTTLDET